MFFTLCYNQSHQTLSGKLERMSYMQENIYNNNYFFVDESGDTTFYNRKGEWIVMKTKHKRYYLWNL